MNLFLFRLSGIFPSVQAAIKKRNESLLVSRISDGSFVTTCITKFNSCCYTIKIIMIQWCLSWWTPQKPIRNTISWSHLHFIHWKNIISLRCEQPLMWKFLPWSKVVHISKVAQYLCFSHSVIHVRSVV